MQDFTQIQNIREDIIGELEVITQYEKHLCEANDEKLRKALQDIIEEENLHVGQLFGTYFDLYPLGYEKFIEGLNEFIQDDDNVSPQVDVTTESLNTKKPKSAKSTNLSADKTKYPIKPKDKR